MLVQSFRITEVLFPYQQVYLMTSQLDNMSTAWFRVKAFLFVLSQSSKPYHSFSPIKYMIPELKIYTLEEQTMQFLTECSEDSWRSRYLKQMNSCIAALHQLLCFENLTIAAYFKNFISTSNIQIHCFKELIVISVSINVNQVLKTSLVKTLFYWSNQDWSCCLLHKHHHIGNKKALLLVFFFFLSFKPCSKTWENEESPLPLISISYLWQILYYIWANKLFKKIAMSKSLTSTKLEDSKKLHI